MEKFSGSTIEVKTQGLCQGNGAAPAGWCVISITILRFHKRKGYGAKFLAPISLVKSDLAAILYVDDTDLLHLIMEKIESIDETFEGLQDSVQKWGKLLIATGGALKPPKYFYTLLDFEWNARGKLKYKLHHEDPRAQLYVPMPDETHEKIEHVSAHEAKETLGIYTCPSGAYKESLEIMAEKSQGWIDRAS